MSLITNLAKKLVQKAGKQALEAFLLDQTSSQQKKDGSFLSQHDQIIEKFIRAEIHKKFPNHSIHGEELPDQKLSGEYTWLIDPIEGTTNFVSGISIFCTMIAVVKKSKVIVAAIYNPFSNKTFWAEKGQGAYVNTKKIKAKNFKSLNTCTLILDSGRDPQKRQMAGQYLATNCNQYRSFRHYGSLSTPAEFVTNDQPLVSFVLGIKDYDIAALSLILQESGCKTMNLQGKPWLLGPVTDFIACSPGLENAVKQTL